MRCNKCGTKEAQFTDEDSQGGLCYECLEALMESVNVDALLNAVSEYELGLDDGPHDAAEEMMMRETLIVQVIKALGIEPKI